VNDYIKYRPGYPAPIIPLLARECGLGAGSRVADIGSGTGLFAELFLRAGCEVYGIEPNREMREAGERLLRVYPAFHSVEGRGEATGLPEASVDLVAAGQSFHWMDADRARQEFRRIAAAPHWVVLAWNDRLVEGSFLEQYEDLLKRYSTDYEKVDHRRVDAEAMERFFGEGRWQMAGFPNAQRFDLAGVLGRLHSSSYAPPPGTPQYDAINREMTHLFQKANRDGVVDFAYETKVYYGRLS
jgi:SAM-dependent methyltransferase